MSIELRTDLTEALIEEGLAREIVSRMQKLRKELGFNVTDRIHTQSRLRRHCYPHLRRTSNTFVKRRSPRRSPSLMK